MLSTTTEIDLERRGEVLWISLNRPERLNAITQVMARELLDTFAAMATYTTVRVIVLRGRGRGFCAGADITRFSSGVRQTEATEGRVHLPDVIQAMRRCPQPIIALVHGPACGGGFAFALASDVRIAGPAARMNDAFVNLGVSGCEMGVSYFLPRLIGLSIASELMYTGRFIDADRALRVGLVSAVVPDHQLEDAATELANEMLAVAPLALRKTKETLTRVLELRTLAEALAVEDATQAECIAGEDFDEGVRAFMEGRRPSFNALPPYTNGAPVGSGPDDKVSEDAT